MAEHLAVPFVWVVLLLALSAQAQADPTALVSAARDRTQVAVTYDGSYRRLGYPDGDVPSHIGVCTDLIVRAFRTAWDRDLQREVHEDMLLAFDAYPRDWGLSRPDSNIDHRRVPNLETYFARRGAEIPATQSAADYQPGDLVTWRLNHRLPHIGIVSDRSSEAGRRMIIHNIGEGPKEEDVLFAYPVHRHFRPNAGAPASVE